MPITGTYCQSETKVMPECKTHDYFTRFVVVLRWFLPSFLATMLPKALKANALLVDQKNANIPARASGPTSGITIALTA